MIAVITGATGFIGSHLARRLHEPRVLCRSPAWAERILGRVTAYEWNADFAPPPAEALAGADVVFHLAGESVATRWTERARRSIRESRVGGTARLVAALASVDPRPRVLVSASAVGYYGDRGDEVLDETSAPGNGFLADVCRAWEDEACRAEASGIRVVRMRIGLVIGRSGGALPRMALPFRLGLGGRLGSGRQWVSWIHIDDLVDALLLAAADSTLRGPVNAVTVTPVRNASLTRELARAVRRPAFLPAPQWAVRGVLGEMASLLFTSQRVIPRALARAGFGYRTPELGEALHRELKPRS